MKHNGKTWILGTVFTLLALGALSLFIVGFATVLLVKPVPDIPYTTPTPIASLCQPAPGPDFRIAEFRQLDIFTVDQSCGAPCVTSVAPSVELDRFIQKVGVPDKLYGNLVGPDFVVRLVYISRGFIADAKRPIKNNYKDMTSDMYVDILALLRARTRTDMVMEHICVGGGPFAYELDNAQDWSGFGPIKVIAR